ncbi:Chromosome transmission fidelity protein 4 [Gigaspora margarita]|uniref:Chromosome transmission fidelity protein 4 n=1 Tax=Gigaspora margarita TaxID=4874 RepID=A0A8H4ABC5_GIGMA|nr:Chromosome transmission fidelity protein 4 [Gigaspora margarita]
MIVDLSQDDMLSDEDVFILDIDTDNLPNVSDKGGLSEPDTIVSDGLSDRNASDIESEKQKDVALSSGDMLDDDEIPVDSVHDKTEIDNNKFSYEREKRDKRIDGKCYCNNEITKPQEPFQPGATPENNNRKYLAMNHIGCITTTFHETYSTITVEFHDQSYNRGYNLRDEFNYSMACLDKNGALYAVESSEMSDSQANPSVLFYKPQETWASKSEWTVTLPQGEDIIAIALCSQGIIVATSTGVIRIFSLCGVQTYILALTSVVCMAGYDELVLIAYHASVGYKGSQSLGYILYNVRTHEILQKDILPITKGSTLKWMGFSTNGLPAIFDSKGVLTILHHHRQTNQGRWVPILNVLSNRKEEEINWTYWPAWFTETTLFCFICKSEAYPQIPRPAFDEISLKVPLLNLDRQTGQCEEILVRYSLLVSFEFEEAMAKNELEKTRQSIKMKNKGIDKALLEMIHLACKEEKQQRALDLSKLLIKLKSLESAIKIARFNNCPILADKICQFKEAKIVELRQLPQSKTGNSSTTVLE